MNTQQSEAWRAAEDHVWRAAFVTVVNATFLAVVGVVALMTGQATRRQLAVGVPVALLYLALGWLIWRRQSRVAAAVLLAVAILPLGTRIQQHAWWSAAVSAVFVVLYALGLYGTIVMHRLTRAATATRTSPP